MCNSKRDRLFGYHCTFHDWTLEFTLCFTKRYTLKDQQLQNCLDSLSFWTKWIIEHKLIFLSFTQILTFYFCVKFSDEFSSKKWLKLLNEPKQSCWMVDNFLPILFPVNSDLRALHKLYQERIESWKEMNLLLMCVCVCVHFQGLPYWAAAERDSSVERGAGQGEGWGPQDYHWPQGRY